MLVIRPQSLEKVTEAGIQYSIIKEVTSHSATRMSIKFLNPKTREQTLERMMLVEIN